MLETVGNAIGDYDIGRCLGKGGFGKVFEAKCRISGRHVAIKVINKEEMLSVGQLDRVIQEVSIHSRLKHPAVLEVLKFFEDHKNVYLVLEMCHNGDLQNYLRKHNLKLKETEAARVLRPVVEGLLYLHSNSIMHRDLKLDNLLLTHDMKIKIGDFGLAAQLTEEASHKTMCGTLPYIPPEVLTHGEHGLAVDLWSLGVVLHALLTGSLHTARLRPYRAPLELSAAARDLLHRLLRQDADTRITLREVLRHEFMAGAAGAGHPSGSVSNDSGNGTACSPLLTSSRLSRLEGDPTGHEPRVRSWWEGGRRSGLCHGSPRAATYHEGPQSGSPRCLSGAREPPQQHFSQCDGSAHCNCRCLRADLPTPPSPPSPPATHSASRIVYKGVPVPVVKTCRLPAVRRRLSNRVVTLLGDGQAVVEVVDGAGRVVRCLRVLPGGLKMVVYSVGLPVADKPPEPPDHAEHYTYSSLPEKYWKEYATASIFTESIKSVTSKITCLGKDGIYRLVESYPRILKAKFNSGWEAELHSSVAVVRSPGGDRTEVPLNMRHRLEALDPPHMMELLDKYYKLCVDLDETLSASPHADDMFPISLGRPSAGQLGLLQPGGVREAASAVSSTTTHPHTADGPRLRQVSSERRQHPRAQSTPKLKGTAPPRWVAVPGVGRVHQLSTGEMLVEYPGGDQVGYNPATESLLLNGRAVTDAREAESCMLDLDRAVRHLADTKRRSRLEDSLGESGARTWTR